MILRKPYALLIQYFQRIHLILIFLCAYIFYSLITLRTFIGDFLETESYNSYYEPISNYTNILFFLSIFIVVAISIIFIVLLRYKKKPWKIYLLPILEYTLMFGVLLYTRSYFNSYNELSSLTPAMAIRDLLNIVYFPQYLIFLIFGIRVLGIDLKQFGFKEDEEYLSIKEEDREEFEVNIEFDKDKITRNIKKFFRNVNYVYLEHKLICNTIIIIIFFAISGYTYYYFGVLHRTYKEGNTFSANYYDITVNSSYLTNNDSRGNKITDGKNNSYLVLNLTVKNNGSKRNINIDRFRVMNKSEQYRYVAREYDYFKDLGNGYSKDKYLATGEEITFILVYKVDSNLDYDKFVLYYHDVTNNILLKKIKLNVNDVRKVKTLNSVSLGEKLTLVNNTNITITSASLDNQATYNKYSCDDYGCRIMSSSISSNNKILTLNFVSNKLTGQSFIDFSSIYATIKYKDDDNKVYSVDAKSIVNDFYGNYAYFSIPNDIDGGKDLQLVFTFRDEEYIYKLN